MGRIRVGLPGVPDRDPGRAVENLLERGYDACEIDFEGSFWMDYPWAERFGEAAREADVALSIHAPLFGFMGHLEASGRKFSSAVGALDRSRGDRQGVRRGGGRLPSGLPARSHPRRRDLLGRRAARDAPRAARGQGAGGAVRRRGDGPRARPRLARRRGRDLASAPAGCGPCSTSPTCTRRATAPTSRRRSSPRRSRRPTRCSSRARRSTSTSRTSPTRTGTRSTTCPTARERSGPSPCGRRSSGSSGRRR